MLGNSENMVVISPTPNEWSQNQIDEKTPMASTQQQALKCPRCDSSNTKFCYYNNYSLSQPRHFCKACKRYWTRGGTLRNVPVGGGCRKNKRVKKVSSTGPPPPPLPPATTSGAPPNPTGVQPRIDLSQPSNHVNPLFYGLPTSISDLNLPFTGGFSSSRVSGYDLQSQLTGLGLGFSSDHVQNDSGSGNGFNPIKQIQDFVTSNSLASSYPMYVPTIPPHPAMASIFSGLHQEKYFSGGVSEIKENIGFRALFPYEDLQSEMKEMKMEEGQRRLLDWNHVSCQNQMEQINPSQSDPSFHWNTPGTGSGAGAWLDPANIGSSVPSLI